MKYINILIIGFLVFPTLMWSQGIKLNQEFTTQELFVSDIKVTHLIFNEKIKYLDIGSRYFIADTLMSMTKIKHTGGGLSEAISQESNLTVVTESGDYYSLLLRYKRHPTALTYRIHKATKNIKIKQSENFRKQQEIYQFNKLCGKISLTSPNISVTNKKDNLKLRVSGLFYQNKHLAIRLIIENNSTIHLDFAKLLLRLKLNKKIQSDYVYQERVIEPKYICNDISQVKGGTQETMTLIFDKFTPNINEKLFIDVSEINGGRSCPIVIPRKKLLSPKLLKQ